VKAKTLLTLYGFGLMLSASLLGLHTVRIQNLTDRIRNLENLEEQQKQLISSPLYSVKSWSFQGSGLATWYADTGNETGAKNNGFNCFANRVDSKSYGLAAPRWIPYCSEVLICRDNLCVIATNVDARASDCRYTNCFDLWPKTAEALGFGPTYGKNDIGVINITFYLQRSENVY